MQVWRERFTPDQSEDPSPTIPTYRKKEEKGKIAKVKKGARGLGHSISIGPALKTRQFHTIEP